MTLITLAATVVLADKERLECLAKEHLEEETDINFLYQGLIFLSSFIGWPLVVNALSALRKCNISLQNDSLDGESFQKGCEVFRTVHGGNAETVEQMMKAASRQIYTEIITDVYGKQYPSCGLDHRQKELLAITALAMTNRQQQLKSHIISAFNAGMTAPDIENVFMVLSWYCGWPLAINAVRSLSQILSVMKMKSL